MKRIVEKIIVGVIVAILLNSSVTAEALVSDALFASRIEKKQEALLNIQQDRDELLGALREDRGVSSSAISGDKFLGRIARKYENLVNMQENKEELLAAFRKPITLDAKSVTRLEYKVSAVSAK